MYRAIIGVRSIIHSLIPLLHCCSTMASSQQDCDYLCRRRKMRSGRIAKPKRIVFVAHKAFWNRKVVEAEVVEVSSQSLVAKRDIPVQRM